MLWVLVGMIIPWLWALGFILNAGVAGMNIAAFFNDSRPSKSSLRAELSVFSVLVTIFCAIGFWNSMDK